MIGPEQRVDEEPRRSGRRVDGGHLLDERAEVRVGAVRLIGQLAHLRVALALGHRDRIRRRTVRALALQLRGRRRFALELGVGALDRALDQLSVKAAVDDDRPAESNSISTPAARARSTSSSVNRTGGGP